MTAPPPGPAGTWCPTCGLFWNVRGCTPEKCATSIAKDVNVVLHGDSGASVSPRALAIIAGAPAMEALLRMAVAACSIVMDGETDEARRERFDGLRKAIYEAGPLLARIDAAGKAGT